MGILYRKIKYFLKKGFCVYLGVVGLGTSANLNTRPGLWTDFQVSEIHSDGRILARLAVYLLFGTLSFVKRRINS